jgi:hypothetical protein
VVAVWGRVVVGVVVEVPMAVLVGVSVVGVPVGVLVASGDGVSVGPVVGVGVGVGGAAQPKVTVRVGLPLVCSRLLALTVSVLFGIRARATDPFPLTAAVTSQP